MCSRVRPRGGTTLETTTASTAAGSIPPAAKSCRTRIPYSSPVRAWEVSMRQ